MLSKNRKRCYDLKIAYEVKGLTEGSENCNNFTLKYLVYLDLCHIYTGDKNSTRLFIIASEI